MDLVMSKFLIGGVGLMMSKKVVMNGVDDE